MQRRRAHDPGLEIDLPITPMLDLAFQVLLFFILTYHPSQLEGQLDLSLPDLAQAKAATPAQAKPDKSAPGDLELPSEVTVIVKTRHDGTHDGGISQISVQERQGTKEMQDEAELRKYLQKIRQGLTNQDDIRIQAESGLRFSYVMEIMDVCTQAGFQSVGFGPPPDQAAETPESRDGQKN